jgi:hypothetical protein
VTITPSINGNALSDTVSFSITPGAVSTATSTVTASPASLITSSGATSLFTVQLKDANGNNLTSSVGTVTFAALVAGQGSIGNVLDNADGTYEAVYTAGTNLGSLTVTPVLNGTSFTNTLNFALVAANSAPTDIALSSATVAENQASGTAVGNFSTTDVDTGNTFTYTLVSGTGDTDNGSFTISGGQLLTNASFDFETKSSYSILVRSTDQGSLTFEKVFTITVTNVNEAPTDIALSSATVAENQASGTAVGNFSTTDVDAGNTFTYSLVSGTGDTDNGSFTISGGQLLTNASFDFETKNSYSIRVRSIDQGSLTYEKAITIAVTNVNEAPNVVAGGTLSYVENSVSSVIDNVLTVADVDSGNLVGASIGIVSLLAGDVLEFVNTANIIGNYDSTTGVLTLVGTDTVANYQAALRSVKFGSTSEDPTANGTRTSTIINWQVNDGALNSTTATSNISLTALNDIATVTAGGTVSYTENASSVLIDATITVSDVDDTQIVGATVSIANPVAGDVLGFTNTANITGTYSNGVLTLTGTDTLANYEAALRSVTFSSSSDNPTVYVTRNDRTISWQVTDANSDNAGTANSTVMTSTVNITAVNDAPVLDLDFTGANRTQIFTSKLNPISFTASGTNLSDMDNLNFDNLKVSFATNLFVDGVNEKLYVNGATNGELAANISATTTRNGSFVLNITTYDYAIVVASGTAIITITGASGAELTHQQAESILDALQYNNASDIRTSMPVRVFTVLATDGDALASNTETLSVKITPSTPSILQGSEDTGIYNNDRVTSDNILTLTGIGGIGDTVAIFSGSTQIGNGVVDSNGTFVITTSVLSNGVHDLYTVASNTLNLSSPTSATVRWEILNAPITQPALVSNNGLPQISGTGTIGTFVTVQLGNATYSVPIGNTGIWSIDLSSAMPVSGSAPAIGLGSYPITVVGRDLAGNASAPVISTLVVNTKVPAPPVVTSSLSTNDTTPVISGISETGTTVTVQLLDGNNQVIATYSNVPTTSGGTWSMDLQTAIPDNGASPIGPLANAGNYNLSVMAIGSNNRPSAVVTQKLVVDTSAPNMPTVSIPTSQNDSTPKFTGTAEPGTLLELVIKRADGTALTKYQTTAGTNGLWSVDFGTMVPTSGYLNNLPDGNYLIEFASEDSAGNRSPSTSLSPFRIDTAAPAAPQCPPMVQTNDTTPVLSGTAEINSSIQVVVAGYTFVTQTNQNGQWSIDLGSDTPLPNGSVLINPLANGIHPVTVVAVDNAGNRSAPTVQSLSIDTTTPLSPQLSFGTKTNDTTPVLNGVAEPNSTVMVSINNVIYTVVADADGAWLVNLETAIPDGGTTVMPPLVNNQTYNVIVSVRDLAGNISQAPAVGSLLIDAASLVNPAISSPLSTNSNFPVFSGSAEPGSTVTVNVNGGVYTVVAGSNGTWSMDIGTTNPTSGSRGSFTDGNYPVTITTSNGSNQSGTVTMNLVVDRALPTISSSGVVTSFGSNLNARESNSDVTVSVAINGIEDGQTASVLINGATFTGTVLNGIAVITIPAATLQSIADGSNTTFTVSATDRAGNIGSVVIPFQVDRSLPATPTFGGISSGPNDPTPSDRFTSVTTPTVVMTGEPGQTIVVVGPNGVVDPSNYIVTETNGLYTVKFTSTQSGGDYQIDLQDANGNSSPQPANALNYFRIDSLPTFFDNPFSRSTSMGRTSGNLAIRNMLNGQAFPVPQQPDGSWLDLDGQSLTFGMVGGTVIERDGSNNPTMVEISENGAVLRLNLITGAYTYTPVPNTARTDAFLLMVRDSSGNQTQLHLSFNSLDTLDRDGIVGGAESTLAGIITGTGNATNLAGDLNNDGISDAIQNSVTTLAWRREVDFQNAINPNTAASTDPESIICMVVNASLFDPNTTVTLAQLMANADSMAQLLEVQVTNSSNTPSESGSFFKPWDVMNFAVESLSSSGLNDINPGRPGTQIQVSFDISSANISTGVFGFSQYRKFVSTATISAYADAGITLTDLSGLPVTTSGWFDYTQRTAGGDGASFKDFNNDGKVDAIILTLTDNSFGDNNPIANRLRDPGNPAATVATNPGGPNPSVPTPPGSNPPSPAPTSFAATGTSTGSVPGTTVNIYPTSTTTPSMVLVPFANWQGEVRIARADINADGNLETIATMGEGGLPILRVFDGATGLQTMEIEVYDRAFNGGIFVAIGDLGNDGILDIVTGAGQGGGPHVKIFNALTGAETSSFMAYDINFRGGVSVAVGDIDGSGFAAIVTGAGQGGGPHVKVFNGTDHSLIKEFMAYASNFLGGVYVAVGDYLSDGKYEIITGAGVGGGPHIKIWDYETLNLDGQTMAFTDFTKPNGEVIDAIFTGGVRVALADANGDNVLDILAGAGPNGGPRVEAFVGFRLELLMDFFTGDKNDERGVFVSQ